MIIQYVKQILVRLRICEKDGDVFPKYQILVLQSSHSTAVGIQHNSSIAVTPIETDVIRTVNDERENVAQEPVNYPIFLNCFYT
jgi:hypothetical protein